MTTIISMRDLSFKKEGKLILDRINWTVKEGENWAILGLNGAGKSSLLRLLTAEYWKSQGDLEVLGTKFGEGDIPSLRYKIGIVSSFLAERFPRTMLAEEIILTGKFKSSILYQTTGKEDLEQVDWLMEQIQIGKLKGRPYASLSQGERQSLLVARSLMENPALLIFDEATSGLDLLARERLLATIESISQMKEAPSILYVTHHAEEITQSMNRVLLLKEGRVMAQGRREEILTSQQLSPFYGQKVQLLPIGDQRFLVHL